MELSKQTSPPSLSNHHYFQSITTVTSPCAVASALAKTMLTKSNALLIANADGEVRKNVNAILKIALATLS